MTIGSLILGVVADSFGRKPVMLVSLGVFFVAMLLMLFTESLTTLYILIFVIAFFHFGRQIISYIMLQEFLDKSTVSQTSVIPFSLDGFTIIVNALLLKRY